MKINTNLQYLGGVVPIVLFVPFKYGDDIFQRLGEPRETVGVETFGNLKKQTSSHGKRIALKGHASVASTEMPRKMGALLSLAFADPDGVYMDYFPFPFGKEEKNSCFLPDSFTPEDLLLYDNEVNPHRYDEDVIVSFTLERIAEAMPEKDPNTGEYFWRYKQLRIDAVG